jgi:glycolate oxidase FAD binding subunit
VRDLIIGVTVVLADGTVARAGGKVVKNVAGYDLAKLYTGSLGTLGVITQLTFKVRPVPEQSTLLGWRCPPAALAAVLDRLHASRTRPVCIDLLSPQAAREVLAGVGGHGTAPDWLVLVGIEDSAEAAAWQVRQVQVELRQTPCGLVGDWTGAASQPLWSALADFPLAGLSNLGDPGGLDFKANLCASAVAEFCLLAEPLAPFLQAHAGSGIVHGHFPADVTLEAAQAGLSRLRARAAVAHGSVVLPRCPVAWKAALDIWGPPRADWSLMRAVKDRLDPNHLFNPGRLFGDR